MQTIIHTKGHTFIHPIFAEFEKLYTALSNDDEPKKTGLFETEAVFDTALRPYEDIFNEYGNCQKYLQYTDKNYPVLRPVNNTDKNVIVTFSGGKDSTAVALYYKERGYNVYLYHVHGLNRFFPFEQQSAEEIAKYLELPIIVEDVSLSGASLYPDHPLKNIIIANMALQWGIQNNIGTLITAGDYYTAHLQDVEFQTAGDDCVEMWDAYRPIIQKYVPDFQFEIPLMNVQDTLESLGKDPKLLELAQSCVMTHRFKNYHNKRVQEKYGIQLMKNRCGTCWKCALEYIYYTDHDILVYNRDYYKYCLYILKNTLYKETNLRYNINETWNHFFFYPQENSKFFKDSTCK